MNFLTSQYRTLWGRFSESAHKSARTSFLNYGDVRHVHVGNACRVAWCLCISRKTLASALHCHSSYSSSKIGLSHCQLGHGLILIVWMKLRSLCFALYCALKQWRRGNTALITTLPVLDCLNSVQHLQPKCLAERFFPQRTRKKGKFGNSAGTSKSGAFSPCTCCCCFELILN